MSNADTDCTDCTASQDALGVFLCTLHKAAPDLLAALEEILHGLTRDGFEQDADYASAMREARTAIAKAEGK